MDLRIEKTDSNVLTVYLDEIKPGWEQWILVSSDRHHDNVHCDQSLEKKHLEEVLKRKGLIIDLGDLHCAMQGKYDPRSDKSSIRPENQSGDYLDSIVRTAADFYAKYAKNWLVMGRGNHETAICKRHETDLTERLISVLNDRTGSCIQSLGYTGWVRFLCSWPKHQKSTRSLVLWYTHGYAAGGPVTQDMPQAARQREYINADIMVSGHVHRSWMQEVVRHRVNARGKLERELCVYVKTPTYKDAYGKGEGGFEVEKGHGPRPLGAYWIRIFYHRERCVDFEIIKAN